MVTKFKAGTIFRRHTTDGRMHSIGKAIRPLFADPVTIVDLSTLMSFVPEPHLHHWYLFTPLVLISSCLY